MALFRDVDTDDSGSIDVGELTVLLRKLEIDATDREIELLHISLDEDKNGSIDFDEFSQWCECERAKRKQASRR